MASIVDFIEWENFDFSIIHPIPYAKRDPGNQRTKDIRNIKNIITAFDIETSRLPDIDQSFCYHWQFQFGFGVPTIHGRTIEEFRLCLDRLAAHIAEDETVLVFVHNLSYEFCWLRAIYPEITNDDLFCLSPRKVARLKLYGGKIEFRCSYILTNLSLSLLTKR